MWQQELNTTEVTTIDQFTECLNNTILQIDNFDFVILFSLETPYGRVHRRRPKPTPQPSSTFTAKDEELLEKIRIFRQNMRKRAKRSPANEYEEFLYRRQNVFDFDAWYRAHFQDDFEKKQRNERVTQLEREYHQQMERIMRGETIRPPRPFTVKDDKALSDIEKQMEEMLKKEYQKDVSTVFMALALFLVAFVIVAYIVDTHTDKSPWVDPYVIRREKQREEEEAKKHVKILEKGIK